MKTFLRLLPAGLCGLLSAAHFLRMAFLPGVLLCLVLPFLLIVRHRHVRRLAVALLVVGCAEWILTTLELVMNRMQDGRPYLRLTLILAGVAAFYLVAAALLFGKRMRGYFYPPRSQEPAGDAAV